MHSKTTYTKGRRLSIQQDVPRPKLVDETTALLPVETHEEEEAIDVTFIGIFKALSRNTALVIVGFLLEACFPLVSTIIAGRLGPKELATVGQGIQIMGVTTTVLVLASTSAQTTLSSPLFTSKKPSGKLEIGVIAQRGFILAQLCTLPMLVVWWFIRPIMISLGQPKSLAVGLEKFLRVMILYIPGYALMETSKAFMQSQSIFNPPTIIVAAVLPFHSALTYYLVHCTSLREIGVALSIAASYSLIGVLLCLWISFSEAKQCWGGWNKQCLRGWKGYLGIMVPSAIMYGSEWWSFEIVSLMAGRLGEISIAAQAAITSMDIFLAMIPYATGLASTVRLGQLLGHNTAVASRAAKVTVRAAYVFAISVTAMLATGLLLGRHLLAAIYVKGDSQEDREVRELIAAVLVPIATYQVSDAVATIGASILRAIALQNLQAIIVIASYYVIGLPLGYYLAYHQSWGLVGLWIGTSVGLFWVGAFGVAFYSLRVNWIEEMGKALVRNESASHSHHHVVSEDETETCSM